VRFCPIKQNSSSQLRRGLAGNILDYFKSLLLRLDNSAAPSEFCPGSLAKRQTAVAILVVGSTPGTLLCRLLLGADVADVCGRYGQPRLDAAAGNRDGGGEKFAVGITPPSAPKGGVLLMGALIMAVFGAVVDWG